jgi:quinoprotein glucose dehydrogenase
MNEKITQQIALMTAFTVLILLPSRGSAESKTADRPNIIFVLCDDLGAGDIGVLWQNERKGKQKFSTPNLDQFAREGMILSRHYCPASSCMASRSSLMTGRHQGHCARRNTQFDSELPDVHTLGSVMQKAGYATVAIGKWGMQGGPFKLSIKPVRGDRSPETEPSHPLLRGFDYFYGYTAHRDAHFHYPQVGNRPLYDGFVDVTDRLAKCYSTDLFTARTKKWIVDHHQANPQQPFFAYLCYTAPHSGLRIPTDSHLSDKGNYPTGGGLNGGVQWNEDIRGGQINTAKGTFDNGMHPEVAHAVGDDGEPWPDDAKRHATMVRRLDDALADLVQLLKDLEIDDRTLVVFTSDNGTLHEAGLDNVGAYKPDYLDTFGRYDGAKLDQWEGGVRMPTFVRWPSVIEAGSESTAASQFHDWMATFCDLSGIPTPAVSDGVSIAPTLTGKGKQERGIVYSEFMVRGATPKYLEFEASRRGRPHGQMQSLLIGDYKGVRVNIVNHQSAFEVYHTLNDPKETTNLAGKQGVPTQQQFQAAVLRTRRIDPSAKRPYDNALIPAVPGVATRAGLIRNEYPGDEYPGNFAWVPQFKRRKSFGQSTVDRAQHFDGLEATSGAQQFAGYLRVPNSGVYHFALTTDGAAVVRLHDALLIDADSQYTAGSKALSGEIALQAGLHPLRINYLAATDAAALSLEWQLPGGKMEPIPNSQFCVIEGNKNSQQPGFTAFFNGKDLTGWEGNSKYWSVNDRVIIAKSAKNIPQNELLWSTVEVKDFYLAVDVKLTPHDRNGGIQFRAKPSNGSSRASGYQADMGQVAGHGNLWGRLYEEGGRGKLDWNTHGAKVVKPGEWNRYEILAVGHRIWTAVNGTLCTSIEDPAGKLSGRIGLEINRGPAKTVQYRIHAFSHDPAVKLAGLDETQLIKRLRKPGKNELVKTDDFAAARKAAAAFRIPKELSIDVFAAKPQLKNPVAICLDEQGRVYVAEDHRFLEGTPENRSHNFLLEDDLQIKTLADRLAMQKKWAGKFDKGSKWFTQKSDIVRRLEDKDGDGQADVSLVFADGFDGPLDGLGSGLIARDGKVWYTCIPNLWLLEDKNGDGKAELKKSLLTGFGVNAAFYGHDLHGLVWGVDGKLYFSVGDRGAHVITKEGTTISNPRRGAVFRCNPDGTELERIHQGLRNPQELAIDQFGNVFADDNNCDKGDDSRLVYVVPGGDSGWNMAYQTIAKPYLTGPWHAEGMWHLQHDLQPAFIVPPVGKIGSGPSGFVFSSGTSLPPRYSNHFFYCNFTGNGGVESFAVKVQGAGFTMADHHDFCKPIKASDVEFGYDGKMYVAEYPTSPWKRATSGGRIYTIFDKTRLSEKVIVETRTLFQKGFRHRTTEELASLLHHDDMRVRLRAQFALAERGNASTEIFTRIAVRDDNRLARLHAIWGLGQIGRAVPNTAPKTFAPVLALLNDEDSEVRAQSARVLGDAHYEPAASAIANLLADDTPRVRFFAALALASLRSRDVGDQIISMLRDNDGKDRYLAHAGVVALEQIGDREFVQQWAGDKSAAVRMAVLLVQRRWSDPRIAQFLDDAELKIVTEAARAINDLPLTTGRVKLANLAERFQNASGANVVPLMRRIINANLQLGGRTNVEAVIGIATSVKQPMVVRIEAVSALSVWQGPTKRDRVTGFWQPIAARDPSTVRDAVQNSAAKLLATAPANLLVGVTKLLTALDIKTDDRAFAAWVADSNRSSDVRIAALRLLENRKYDQLSGIIDSLLRTDRAELRAEARDVLASRDEARATSIFSKLLDDQNSESTEKQRAIAALARLKSQAASRTLDDWADRLRQGKAPAPLQLDLIEAFTASPNAIRQAAIQQFNAAADESDTLAAYRVALIGGNAKSGRDIFVGHVTAQCIRCHKVDNRGGSAGPDLSNVASPERKLDRRHFLESIVSPNAKIAKGFGAVSIVLDNGKLVAGTIKAEDAATLTLVTPENKTIRIDRGHIDTQSTATSAMPETTKTLTLREIRDLVEYLSTLEKNKNTIRLKKGP